MLFLLLTLTHSRPASTTQHNFKRTNETPLTERAAGRDINPAKPRLVTPKGDSRSYFFRQDLSSRISSNQSKMDKTTTPEIRTSKTHANNSNGLTTYTHGSEKTQASLITNSLTPKTGKLFKLAKERILQITTCYQQKAP